MYWARSTVFDTTVMSNLLTTIKKIWRSFWALFAGWLVFIMVAAAVGESSEGVGRKGIGIWGWIAIGIGLVVSGYITAAIAKRAEIGHAIFLAALIEVQAVISAESDPNWHRALWIFIAAGPGLIAGSAIGGYLRVIELRRARKIGKPQPEAPPETHE
jgi:hypothetical protein